MTAPLVVVGASLAGLRAAESARKAGWDGRVVLVGAEEHLPYDRPPLSKALLGPGASPETPTYLSRAELDALGIELRLGAPAEDLDVDRRRLQVGGESVEYGALVVATGAQARRLPGPLVDGVHPLRTLADARVIRSGLDAGARTVVIGAGFIGSEVASAARARGLDVTMLEAAPVPLERAVGGAAAALITALHADAGVDLRCGASVTGFEQRDGRVCGVRLGDGTTVPADLVVEGVGTTPSTSWLAGSGLDLDDGVRCDSTLQAAPRVWAAGDVARVDHPVHGSVRLEHWTSAAEQGRLAGANAARVLAGEQPVTYDAVPYFWSDVYGHKLQMVGRPSDDAEVLGDSDGPWLVLYRQHRQLSGALSLDLPGRIMKFRALLARSASFADAVALATSRPLRPATPVAS